MTISALRSGLILLFFCSGVLCYAQDDTLNKYKGWHLYDNTTNGYLGISLEKAYKFLQEKKMKGRKVIVAVIDGGTDTAHEDLRPVLWKNTREVPGNGADDDRNGYTDDRYGWNFLGGKNGKTVSEDSDEGLRVFHLLRGKYEQANIDETQLSAQQRHEYRMWKKADDFIRSPTKNIDLARQRNFFSRITRADSVLALAIGKPVYKGKELDSFFPSDKVAAEARNFIYDILKRNNALENTGQDLVSNALFFLNDSETKMGRLNNPPVKYRELITGDDEYNFNERKYGMPDVMGQFAEHGTHVAGILCASRTNKTGIEGVADNVQLMTLLVVPKGDEHDKDIALAIRYAADNGAKVVNMSFGKYFSAGKKWIDDAVEYAEKKGVLLLHAAGNDAKDLDAEGNDSYPNPYLLNGRTAPNWITVGASNDPKLGPLAAPFSNYGKKSVDVFAPGVLIYSTLPGGNVYGFNQGTSMATPVVSGIAAILKSYFPVLTPVQIKSIIEKSVVIPGVKTVKPGAGPEDAGVTLDNLCKTGGVVNAYNAVKLAYEVTVLKKKL